PPPPRRPPPPLRPTPPATPPGLPPLHGRRRARGRGRGRPPRGRRGRELSLVRQRLGGRGGRGGGGGRPLGGGLSDAPPVVPPAGLRRYLAFTRLSAAALQAIARVVDNDDGFRARVAAE